MKELEPFTIYTDRCIVCQEEKLIVAEGSGFHRSWTYWIASMVFDKAWVKEKFCDDCFNLIEESLEK